MHKTWKYFGTCDDTLPFDLVIQNQLQLHITCYSRVNQTLFQIYLYPNDNLHCAGFPVSLLDPFNNIS